MRIINESIKSSKKKLGLASQQSFLPSLEQFYKSKIKDQIFPRFMLAWFMVACRFALLCSLLISAFVKSVLDIHNANPIYILHFKWFNFLYQCYHTIIYKINKTIHWTFLKGKAARIKIFCESSFKLETIIYMNFHCSERWQYNLDYLI